jgi:NTP pyrophosphatase (non-canonical NTP hydrolase)
MDKRRKFEAWWHGPTGFDSLNDDGTGLAETAFLAGLNARPDIDGYSAWAKKMWFSTGGKDPAERDITIASLGLAGEVGEVMELLKKRVRDGTFDEVNLKKELGDVIFYWARLCEMFGLTPSEVLQANIEKNESRKARGTQRGSGDDR